MTISKERAEELKNRLLIQLRSKFEEIYHDVQAELEEDPIKFLFDYVKYLKRDPIDFPLSRWDFTEEELKYFKFYE